MPRVHHVKKARKDHPGGIKKGESYYHWSFRYGGKHVSKTYPRPSQLTSSDKLSRLYSAQENFEDNQEGADKDALEALCQEAANEVREVGEEYRESCDNIRESFENSPVADDCEEKADACDSLADALEYLDFNSIPDTEPEEPDADDKKTWGEHKSHEDAMKAYDEAKEEYDNALSEVRDEIMGIDWDF